ncbi:WYL domain-containing protein [Opitutaceae bacterium]
MATTARIHPRRQSPADCGRSALRRIVWIHELLLTKRRATAQSLAQALEVSDRTIKRDIETMRDSCGAVISWDAKTHSYLYEKPCTHLPLLHLDSGEALALVLASQVFGSWHGSALGRALTAALGKIATTTSGAVSLSTAEVSKLIFQPEAPGETDGEHRWFAPALEAIQGKRELAITYHKPNGKRGGERRLVHPLHLAYLDHRWVLIAQDPSRDAPRNFLLSRISRIELTGARFVQPAGFDLKTYLRGSLGRFTGDQEIEVRVVLDASLVPYLRERPWHPSQTLAERPDGTVEASFKLNNLIDVERRILACGAHAEVLAPPELRASVRAAASALLNRYDQTKS